jgi:hypothetical protein
MSAISGEANIALHHRNVEWARSGHRRSIRFFAARSRYDGHTPGIADDGEAFFAVPIASSKRAHAAEGDQA